MASMEKKRFHDVINSLFYISISTEIIQYCDLDVQYKRLKNAHTLLARQTFLLLFLLIIWCIQVYSVMKWK